MNRYPTIAAILLALLMLAVWLLLATLSPSSVPRRYPHMKVVAANEVPGWLSAHHAIASKRRG